MTHEAVVRLFDHLVRCETRLYNGADAVLQSHGLAMSQLEFLRYVRDHPGSRAADVAAFFAIGGGATSKGIARLEARGWMMRIPNPDDARSSLLDLTTEGHAVVDRAWTEFAGFVTPLFASAVTDEELQVLLSVLGRLRIRLEQAKVGTPAG